MFFIIIKLIESAAIAQSVERILGKDEVASSNLASSSMVLVRFHGFLLCRDRDFCYIAQILHCFLLGAHGLEYGHVRLCTFVFK